MIDVKTPQQIATCSMKYTRTDYDLFLLAEIDAQKKDYQDLVYTRALVLKTRGDVFVGRYLSVQGNGMLIFKVRHTNSMPRKNTYWTACYFSDEMGSYKNWGNLSWADLREGYQRRYSDAYCAWVSKSDDPDFCLIGIKGITLDFASLLEEDKPIVAFGPKDPPLKYLFNLRDLVSDEENERIKTILDYDESRSFWNPDLIEAPVDFPAILDAQFESFDGVVVQGPPGVGKTFRIAQFASLLLSRNKSILVTALTNQALMELAEKDAIAPFLTQGKVSKTGLTIDEKKSLPNLKPVIGNKCNATTGKLTLATFYISSGWANEVETPAFDYVLMDEASQALLPMIAATMKLGSKIVWIGDQQQLPPIVCVTEDVSYRYGWNSIITGFETLCANFRYPSYMLKDTFRLTQRAASISGVFYQNNLRSVSEYQQIPSSLVFTNKAGGPVLVRLELKVGETSPKNAFKLIFDRIKDLLGENPKATIAVLSKLRDSVRDLQKHYLMHGHTKELPANIKIETVDRVQGLTVDYCFFLIPNTSYKYSLDLHLFNVATSRARYNTFIIADNNIFGSTMAEEVREYLIKTDRG